MKQLSILILLSIFLMSCNSIDGTIDVREEISLNTQNGSLNLEEGVQEARLEFRSKRTAYLHLEDKRVRLQIPRGIRIPTNGSFDLTSNEIGQDYDMSGRVETDYSYGPILGQWQRCVYNVPRRFCNPRGCWTQWVTVHGSQHVQFREIFEFQDIDIDLIDDEDIVASFHGTHESSKIQNISISACR